MDVTNIHLKWIYISRLSQTATNVDYYGPCGDCTLCHCSIDVQYWRKWMTMVKNTPPVAYFSRTLLPRKQQYSSIEKECWTIAWAIESLRVYLYVQQSQVVKDQKAFQWVQRMQNRNNSWINWPLKLHQYMFNETYRSGNDNLNADYLSRIWTNCQTDDTEHYMTFEQSQLSILRFSSNVHNC